MDLRSAVGNKTLLSHTMMETFQCCRKQFEYIYRRGITPAVTSDSLMLGGFIHGALELWFKTIKRHQEDKNSNWIEKRQEFSWAFNEMLDFETLLSEEDKLKAVALIDGYIDMYSDDLENFTIVGVECEFAQPLMSPDGKEESKTFCLGGKIDCLVRDNEDGSLYILEHKTARSVNEGYIGRVSIDAQTALYAMAVESALREPVHGVIYDVLVKPQLKMSKGETDEEYEARKAASKTGRIKRKEAESNDEFLIRLKANMTDENFVRVYVSFDDERREELSEEIWAIASDIENCRCFYKCTGNCLKYGVCPFMSICKAHGEISNLTPEQMAQYKVGSSIHPELSTDLTSQFKEIF